MKIILSTFLFFVLITPAVAKPLRVVALGDSLMSGYALQKGDDYPSQLQTALRAEKIDVVVDNASVTGDTTEGGLSRLEDALKGDKPDLVIVSLGGNDLLRSIDPQTTAQNLRRILQTLKDKDISAVLFGMRAPPFQVPSAYRQAFNKIYPDLADDFDIELYPFFLDGVMYKSNLNIGDGIHPNKMGVAVMVDNTVELIADELDD